MLPVIVSFLGHHPTPTSATPTIHGAERKIAKTESHLVSGHGAPRANYGECQAQIADFQKNLELNGITALEPIKCLPYAAVPESFAPHFRGSSVRNENYTVLEGSSFNGLSFCQLHRLKMAEEAPLKSHVLESTCVKISSNVYANAPNEMFVPIFVLKQAQASQVVVE